MAATQLSERTRKLILSHIKANIATELANIRIDRNDPIVNTDPPRSYFIFDGAHTYQCPAIFVVVESMDFPEDRLGPNHVNATAKVFVSAVVEGSDAESLTIKSERYQAALFYLLHWQTLQGTNGSASPVAIAWDALHNASAGGGIIINDLGSGADWDSWGAATGQFVDNGGYVETSYINADPPGYSATLALNRTADGSTIPNSNFCMMAQGNFGSGFLLIQENGNQVFNMNDDLTGVFRIENVGGIIKYKKNGTVFFTSVQTPAVRLFPLFGSYFLNQGLSNPTIYTPTQNQNTKIFTRVLRCQFSPVYTKKSSGTGENQFRKEVSLELEVKHYENPNN